MNNILFNSFVKTVCALAVSVFVGCEKNTPLHEDPYQSIRSRITLVPFWFGYGISRKVDQFIQLCKEIKETPETIQEELLNELRGVLLNVDLEYPEYKHRILSIPGRARFASEACNVFMGPNKDSAVWWEFKLLVFEKCNSSISAFEQEPEYYFHTTPVSEQVSKKESIAMNKRGLALYIRYGFESENSGFPRYLSTLPPEKQSELKRRLEKMMLGEEFIPWQKWKVPRRRKK